MVFTPVPAPTSRRPGPVAVQRGDQRRRLSVLEVDLEWSDTERIEPPIGIAPHHQRADRQRLDAHASRQPEGDGHRVAGFEGESGGGATRIPRLRVVHEHDLEVAGLDLEPDVRSAGDPAVEDDTAGVRLDP